MVELPSCVIAWLDSVAFPETRKVNRMKLDFKKVRKIVFYTFSGTIIFTSLHVINQFNIEIGSIHIYL